MKHLGKIAVVALTLAALIDRGPKGAVVTFFVSVMMVIAIRLIAEMVFMIRYRDEYLACTDAVLSEDERVVDEVNRWTTHYYVHKAFSMSASADGLKVGYVYSIRDRPRESGGAGGDIGFVWF